MLSRFLLFLSLVFAAGQALAVPVAVITPTPESGANLASGEDTLAVSFSGASSTVDDGDSIAQYDWLLNGVTAMQGVTVEADLQEGSHTMSLTVTTEGGLTSIAEEIAYVVNPAVNQEPTASFAATPQADPDSLTVNFVWTGDHGDGASTFSWDFGDGSALSVEQEPEHTYASAGDYTVSLTVTDGGDGDPKDTVTTGNTVTVTAPSGNNLPTATFTAIPRVGAEALTVDFVWTGVDGDDASIFLWEFGDGATSTLETPVHTYAGSGDFSVTLTVFDGADADQAVEVNIVTVVAPIPAPVPEFNVEPGVGGNPQVVRFTYTGTLGLEPTTILWTFGDGVQSEETNPVHAYVNPGSYNVTVSLTDSNENNSQLTKNINVTKTNEPPVAKPENVNVISGKEITINVLTNDEDENQAGLQVDFVTQPQNGSAEIIDGTKVKYQSNAGFTGTDSFKYVARDDEGLKSAEITVTIGVARDNLPPEVTIDAPPFVNGGNQVVLNGTAIDPEGDDPLTYQWTQVSGAKTVEIINADQIDASFLSPIVVERLTLIFRLKATDALGAEGFAEFAVEIGDVEPPVAVIDTPDLDVFEGSTVRLSGRGIFLGKDLADSERIARWEQVEIGDGPIVPISDNSQSEISFVAPEVDNQDGTKPALELKFQLNIVTQDIPAKSEVVTITVGDNGIVGIDGYITTKSDQDEIPFGIKTPEGDLIALEPVKIGDTLNNTNRPRRTPIGLIEIEVKTAANGAAVIEIKLTEPLPEDYVMYSYSDENGWEVLSTNQFSINSARDIVTLTLDDLVSTQPRALGDINNQAGIVKFRGGPGQESRPVTANVSIGGGAFGLWLLLMTALLKWPLNSPSKLRFKNLKEL